MKLRSVVLTVSLATNVVLFGWLVVARRSPANLDSASVQLSPASPASASSRRTDLLAPNLGRDFLSLTSGQLRDQLRASDLPANLVEQLVSAQIRAPLEARRRELVAEALKMAPPWRLGALRSDRFALLTPEQRKELRDLEIATRDETLRLLGPALLDRDGTIAFKYGFVSPEKAVRLDALDRDYANLATLAKEQTRYLKTPRDQEREKVLRTEQERDLAALLTPEEREAYELRVSATAQNQTFQGRMAALQPTEAEYRALFALQKSAAAKAAAGETDAPTRGVSGATMVQFSGSNLEPAPESVRAALGEERFADWQLAGAEHYQGLMRLAASNGLPPETVKSVATLLNETSNASWKIAENAALGVPEKKAALAELAANARERVVASLGAELADSYLKATRWFDGIATGTAVQIDARAISFRSVDSDIRGIRGITPAVIGEGILKIAPSPPP